MTETNLLTTLQSQTSHASRTKQILGALAVLAVAVFSYRHYSGDETTITYQTTPITQGDLHVTVAASGTLEPTNVVTIGSELSGIVSSVSVDVNDRVQKGQLLAQLDPSKLNDTITKSEAALAAAEAGVKQAEATLQEANASLSRQRELARLSNNRLPSKAEMDTAVAAVARAVADKASAEATVAQAQATLSSDKTNLEKASIRSPIDGVVLSRSIEPGQTVAASLSAPTLFEIAEDLSQMELQVDVDEADVGQVKTDQTATFTVDAYPGRTYPATITRVSYGATTTDNVVSYLTTLKVDNNDLSLRPGMTASATINTETRSNVLLVPSAALRYSPPATDKPADSRGIVASLMPRMPSQPRAQTQRNDGPSQTIWILENNVPKAYTVTRGSTSGNLTEVSGDGLQAGLPVITGSSSK